MAFPPPPRGPGAPCQDLEAALACLGAMPDSNIDLAEGALWLAAWNASRPYSGDCMAKIERLAARLAELYRALPAENPLAAQAEALRVLLAEETGFACERESYDDLANANLDAVLARKRGWPASLGLLTIALAERLDWHAAGLDFPNHFLVRLDHRGARTILDPGDGWAPRTSQDLRALVKTFMGETAELTADHYRPVEKRQVLLRLQNNVRLRQARAGDDKGAAASLKAMLLIAPDEPDLWRSAGLQLGRRGNFRAASQALSRFLELAPGDPLADETSGLLESFQSRFD